VRQYEGFRELYEAEFQKVVRAAYAVCGETPAAVDAAQEAFARALSRWGRLKDVPWVVGWIVRTAMNQAKREGALQRSFDPVAVSPFQQSHSGLDERSDLVAALRSLPRRQREALVLHYVADLPLEQVAAAMGTADGTVKAHLFRGREALRGRLGESYAE
jgi:RNA polymerase sigma-70 factor (ECF subfamily)